MLPETRYAYSVARIRVAEINMLDRNRIERMIDSDTVAGTMRILNEIGYSGSVDYEQILKKETANLYAYLKSISPEPEVFDIFAHRYDSHNLKVLIKSELSGNDNENLLTDNGVFDKNELRVMVRERDLKKLPVEFADAVVKILDVFARTKDPQIIDILLDKAYYVLFMRLATDTGSKYLMNLAKLIIDIANINAFIRIKSKMEDLDLLSRVLIEGGNVPVELYTRSFGNDMEVFREQLKGSGYSGLLDVFLDDTGGITVFEKACDNFIMAYVRKYKNRTFGIEPLIGYMLGKETEIKNARIILVGKINRISRDTIRERLRDGYV